MNSILATATTWAMVCLFSATITTKLIDITVSQFSSISEATSGKTYVQPEKHITFDTLFDDFDWSPEGGVAEAAVALSERFTLLVTSPAH
jgi:hypothetical protein